MFPLTALLTCDLMNEEAKNQRLFYKLCSAELSKISERNQEIFLINQEIIKTLNEISDDFIRITSDSLEKTLNIFLGKGHDKLEQWRRGEIDCIHPDEVDIFNWNIYLNEKSKKIMDEWNKNHPTYFEDLKKKKEERRKHMTKEELAQDLLLELMMMH